MNIKLIFLVLLVFQISYSQTPHQMRDLEIMEKLSKEVENDKKTEFEAKKIVLNFYYDTKNLVRERYQSLTDVEQDELDKAQKFLWEAQVVNALKIYKGLGYKGFLDKEYNMLLRYNEAILDLLYYALDNDLSDKSKSAVFNEKIFLFSLDDWSK